ncbi:MAG TPA: hypothetical protein VFQ23_24940, partial [Anaerolineales bacterium]|nr:hypothetical protein [Anaerolineales bacterium]
MVKRHWLKWVLVSYLTLMVVVLTARFVLPTSHWLSWGIDHFLLIFFVPIPILFLICIHLRESFILLALPAFAFLVLYGRLFSPARQPEHRSDAIPIRVMTFNVLFTNLDQEAVAQVIKDSGADLVALQELTPRNG